MPATTVLTEQNIHYLQLVKDPNANYKALANALQLRAPIFDEKTEVPNQLKFIIDYAYLNCDVRVLSIEDFYIDWDFQSDFSNFYCQNVHPCTNVCKRIHFFKKFDTGEELHDTIQDFVQSHKRKHKAGKGNPDKFKDDCKKFSEKHYVGFSVIKPLPGSPVGRTVLKILDSKPGNNRHEKRFLTGTRIYIAHHAGMRLTVKGLAFQQQDIGVSACATTAMWSSLQQYQALEDTVYSTPSDVTLSATAYDLTLGRAMPSEGLTVGQMCQAIKAQGASPELMRCSDFFESASLLYAIVCSNLSPVLILKDNMDPNSNRRHAVTVAGIKISATGNASEWVIPEQNVFHDMSCVMKGVYVHDDRIGPYSYSPLTPGYTDFPSDYNLVRELKKEAWFKALKKIENNQPPDNTKMILFSETNPHTNRDKPFENRTYSEHWEVQSILVPMSSKIQLSFPALNKIARNIMAIIEGCHTYNNKSLPSVIKYRYLIHHKWEYFQNLLLSAHNLTDMQIAMLSETIAMCRYIGIVRFEVGQKTIEFIIDTTSTLHNSSCLAIIPRPADIFPEEVLDDIGRNLQSVIVKDVLEEKPD